MLSNDNVIDHYGTKVNLTTVTVDRVDMVVVGLGVVILEVLPREVGEKGRTCVVPRICASELHRFDENLRHGCTGPNSCFWGAGRTFPGRFPEITRNNVGRRRIFKGGAEQFWVAQNIMDGLK